MNRRRFLAGASAAVVGLAGCLAEDGTDDGTDGGDEGNQTNGNDGSGSDGSDNDGGDEIDGGENNGDNNDGDETDGSEIDLPDGVATASIQTSETKCGTSDADRFDADLGETVTITGTLSAPNPCHEAVFGELALDGDELAVTIDVKDTSDEMCEACIGEVSYEATIELDDSEATTATLDHATGGSYSIEESRDYPNPTVADTAIEMVGAECGTEDDATAHIEPGKEAVEVTGTVIASNPCHRAVIADTAIEDATLSAEIGLEETETDVCESCTGAISYEATVTVEEMKGLESVSLSHPDGTEYGASWQSASTSANASDSESSP